MNRKNKELYKEEIFIKGEKYYFVKDYEENEEYRQSFNRLTEKVFGFNLESWYKKGYWTDKYSPHSLLYKGNIVANVSVNTMEFSLFDKGVKAIQLGTVMTDPEFRNGGLSRTLMEFVLSDIKERYDLVYLYGNNTVTDFYPKFGFVKSKEYVHWGVFKKEGINASFYKLDIKNEKDRKILIRLVKNTIPISKISMLNNMELIMFYLDSFMADNIYYSREMDLAAIIEYGEGELLLVDIFSANDFNLEELIPSLLKEEMMKVTLGFTPRNDRGFQIEAIEGDDTFFVLNKSLNIAGRFPMLSHT